MTPIDCDTLPGLAGSPESAAIPSADGRLDLHGWLWPAERPRATLVIAHGLGEHAGCYDRTADALRDRLGLDVVAADFRGHGLSPGPRGVVRSFDELTADLCGVLDWVSARQPGLPRFLLGHSNGGQVALRCLLGSETSLTGLILSNPALRLALPVPRHKVWIGELLRRFAPGMTLPTSAADTLMTSDPEELASRRLDRHRHSRISAPLFFGMIEGGPWIAAGAGSIRLPVLLLLSGRDTVVDPAAARELYERLGSADKTLIEYPDALHEPLNDFGREAVLDDLADWIERRIEAEANPCNQS